ncbi:hypothetical protein BGZ57DRAFT_875105 [Hyaloscypha finlandica]|nr:hypothetical protein BGZ57DRAFT_875105 [Hyaloscypha finlandica]
MAGVGNGKHAPFTVSKAFLKQILVSNRLSKRILHCTLCNSGSLSFFSNYEESESNKPSSLAILIRTPYGPYHDFTVVLRIDISRGTVVCLLFCKFEKDLNRLWNKLRLPSRCKELRRSPLSFLALLFEDYGSSTEVWRDKLDQEVVRLERRTGMTSLHISPTVMKIHHEYELFTRDLHSCHTDLIFLGDMLSFEMEFGTFCTRLLDTFEGLRKQNGMDPYHSVADKDGSQQNLSYWMNISRFRYNQTQALKMRIQSQINVMYSLISQRDSRINLRIAEAVQQDSRTMKTIALLTLIFLPGTLVASIFSTGVIDLRANGDGIDAKVVAHRWWMFAVTTFLLTLIVITVWFLWNWKLEQVKKRKQVGEKFV